MAIFSLENSVYQLGCDTADDVENLPTYAQSNNVTPGQHAIRFMVARST